MSPLVPAPLLFFSTRLFHYFINIYSALRPPTLNKNSLLIPCSHCPISFIYSKIHFKNYSKIHLKKKTTFYTIFISLLDSFLTLHQLCFHPHHFTEIVLIKVTSNLHITKSSYQFSVLISFDQLTDFDTAIIFSFLNCFSSFCLPETPLALSFPPCSMVLL